MKAKTAQLNEWCSTFGREYTDRNNISLEDQDKMWMRQFGMTRSSLYQNFFGNLDKGMKILEVGCNIGLQLVALKKMGFTELYAIEPQSYAIEKAREHKWLNAVQASAFDIPFKSGYFDLVKTSGVLIHISPDKIHDAMDEIYRCSRKFIFGLEYFSPQYEVIHYRGKNDLCWKADFAKMYLDRFKDLELLKEHTQKYSDSNNVDKAFLLKKKS